MAEAFGVAAGAIGVVSLGIQLAESLQKVKSFCASVKNAPLHIAELIEEIEIMRDILSDLESGCLSANVASSSNMHRCLKIAQRATIGLVSFSNELQARIKKSRFRGGARFALSRDEIKQMLNQLERTKSSLILAYSIYREAIADDRHSVMLQATSRGQESPARKSPAVSLLVQASASSAYNKSTFAPHKLMVGKTLFQVTTPRWMSDTIWQLEMRSSFSGLNVFTRSYGIVPSDAPIFEACKVGDDSEIQRLLDSGLASPFDEDQWGCSLWDTALEKSRMKSLRCLRQYGTLADYRTRYKDPVRTFYIFATFRTCDDYMLPYASGRRLQEDVNWLHDAWNHDIFDASEKDSLEIVMNLLSCPSSHADHVWFWQILHIPYFVGAALRGKSQTPLEDLLSNFQPQDHDGKTPLHILAVNAAYHLRRGHFDVFQALEKMITITINSGAKLHEEFNCHTALLLFLSAIYGCRDRELELRTRLVKHWLMLWLKALKNAGVDLVTYGAEENLSLQRFASLEDPAPLSRFWSCMSWCDYNDEVYHFQITHGPNPEDWTVQVDLPLEQYAFDFWQITTLQHESDALSIPGSWLDTETTE